MERFSTNAKQTSLGLVAMLASLALLELLPRPWSAFSPREGFFYLDIWPDVWGMFMVALAAAAGAYVARGKFAIAAVVVVLALSIIVTLYAQTISEVAKATGFHEIFARNLFGLVFAIVGAVVGAVVGERLSRHFQSSRGHAV